MKKLLIALFVLGIAVMHAQYCDSVWLQEPDPVGVDVDFSYTDVADDFEVAEDVYICAIRFWISWRQDVNIGTLGYYVGIYSDVAAGVDLPWSHPGVELWSNIFYVGDGITTIDEPLEGLQDYYYPLSDELFTDDHFYYYQVNCGDCDAGQYISDVIAPFHATGGTVYWLLINPLLEGGEVGWKTSWYDYNDTAVYYDNQTDMIYEPILIPSYDPVVNLAFQLCGCTSPTCPVELSSFNAAVTHSNFVQLNWTTESESDLMGYNVLRCENENLNEAFTINTDYIAANNSTTQCDYVFTDTDVEMNRSYNYWLESVEMNGSSEFFGPVNVIVEDGGGQTPPDPVEIIARFDSVYPNPFNPNTSFKYTLPEAGEVTFHIYNTKGQLVDTIVDHGVKGDNHASWNATGQASGIYMVHMQANGFESMQKAVLIK